MAAGEPLRLVAICAAGLEELLEAELAALGVEDRERQRGAVRFTGDWRTCWRANWRLRTASRVLIELGSWPAADGAALAAGARALVTGRLTNRGGRGATRGSGTSGAAFGRGDGSAEGGSAGDAFDLGELLHPDRSFVIHATTTASQIRDTRWAALSAKDGLVDGQRDRWGRRSDVDRDHPDLELRLRLHEDHATLLLDTSGEPLDRRGYRALSTLAPVRETLAAACVLASGWDGTGAVVDPMCGSGTLLIEAGWLALGIAPGHLRAAGGATGRFGSGSTGGVGSGATFGLGEVVAAAGNGAPDGLAGNAVGSLGHPPPLASGAIRGWAFERLPGFDPAAFAAVRAEPLPAPGSALRLVGNDRSPEALRAARANLELAGLGPRAQLLRGDAADCRPPEGRGIEAGLVIVNPPYGERAAADAGHWKALGDLLKKQFPGWRAAVLAGGEGLGKHIGLRPRRRLPVKNGPLDARILIFDLF